MKKVLALLLALTLVLSLAVLFTACNGTKGDPTSTTEPETVDETDAEDETEAPANLPKAGETVKFGSVSVTIPEGWKVEEYNEGKSIEIVPEGAFLDSVEISVNQVYGNDHAKEWADNILGNYNNEGTIDNVTIAGKSFYRVKAKEDQNICFTDLDDSTYLKVSVMFMPWETGKAVLDTIVIG